MLIASAYDLELYFPLLPAKRKLQQNTAILEEGAAQAQGRGRRGGQRPWRSPAAMEPRRPRASCPTPAALPSPVSVQTVPLRSHTRASRFRRPTGGASRAQSSNSERAASKSRPGLESAWPGLWAGCAALQGPQLHSFWLPGPARNCTSAPCPCP